MAETGFAKLLGENFAYVLTEKSLILGRKQKDCKQGTFEISESKSISRRHADLKWDYEKECWIIKCLGKNGFDANGIHYTDVSDALELNHKDKLIIGGVTFFFLLPIKQ